MQYKQTAIRLLLLLFPITAFTQTTYFPQDAREQILLERMEIRGGHDSILNFSKTRPFSRKQYLPLIEQASNTDTTTLNTDRRIPLTSVDQFNAEIALMNSPEWTARSFQSKRTFLKKFYRSPANLYEVETPDFFLSINPVFQYLVGKEQDNDQHLFLNTRGATLRARIGGKIGVAAYITDNQERDPLYVQQWVTEHKAVPGAGFYKSFKTAGYDYFDARGYVTFNAARYVDIQFGYDKNFIGNGYRSLFLSDFSSPYLFLKLNARVWKFNYQTLFAELNSAQRLNADQLFPKKYAAVHHLDIGVTKWLNVGLFEAVVFGRENHFEFGYLNPVIFYRSIEQQNGSFDNAVAGIDFKANVAKHFQFYGQLLIDEFNLTEMRKARGWWGNKYGFQLGAKYIDAFNIPNLDLQVESNRVRPFTYSHRDSVANYTHYNQPLAHPLGANFQEWIGILRYQPVNRVFVEAKLFYYNQGRDLPGESFGGNIFLPNVRPYRKNDFGYDLGSGVSSKTALGTLLLSYQLKPNFFIEVNGTYRNENQTVLRPGDHTLVIYAGVRWNTQRRNFEF